MKTLSAARLDEALKLAFPLEPFANLSCCVDHGGPGDPFVRVEIENQSIRTLDVGNLRTPRMNLEHVSLNQLEQPGQGLDRKEPLRLKNADPATGVAPSPP